MQDKDDLLAKLNPVQREAARHGENPLLLIAGAGTGKTTTLVHRVAYQIASGISPSRIMLLTFTRRAAQQMVERLRRISGDDLDISGIWAGTFHATSVRLLRIFGEAIGVPARFTMHDRSDSEDLLDSLLNKLKKDVDGELTLPRKGTALSMHSFQVNSQLPLEEVLDQFYPDYSECLHELQGLFDRYQKQKRQVGIVDYDDLLLLMRDLLRHPEVGVRIGQRFERVLVDEYQDTNSLQAQVLMALCPTGKGLTAVGDDAQSIYSFRAATVRNILDFPEQFLNTTLLKLEQNYRGTQPLLDVSNALMSTAKEGFTKSLWSDRTGGFRAQLISCVDESQQAEMIVERILRHRKEGIPLASQAVLFRAAYHSLALETELNREKLPYVKFGGLKFAESAHVKDLLAFLRLAENTKDTVAAIRILLLIPGIGPKKAGQCVDMLQVTSTGLSIWNQVKPPSSASLLWKSFVHLMTELESDRPKSLKQQLEAVMNFYGPLLEDRYDNAPLRKRDLEQLISMADRFESRQQMLVDLTIDPPSSTEDVEADRKRKEPPLVLSTIHSAKGLEWPVVFVMSAAAGMLPMPKAAETLEGYEEERRLLYVAMTRAADWLYVSYPQPRYDFRGGWSNATVGGMTEYITPPMAKMFQRQHADCLSEIERIDSSSASLPQAGPSKRASPMRKSSSKKSKTNSE